MEIKNFLIHVKSSTSAMSPAWRSLLWCQRWIAAAGGCSIALVFQVYPRAYNFCSFSIVQSLSWRHSGFFGVWGVLSRLGARAFVILQTNFLQWIGIRQISFAKSFMLEGVNQVCTSYQCSSISLTIHHVPNVNFWMRSCILSSHNSSEFSDVFHQWWTISPDSS